jgi:hypothetical protein
MGDKKNHYGMSHNIMLIIFIINSLDSTLMSVCSKMDSLLQFIVLMRIQLDNFNSIINLLSIVVLNLIDICAYAKIAVCAEERNDSLMVKVRCDGK